MRRAIRVVAAVLALAPTAVGERTMVTAQSPQWTVTVARDLGSLTGGYTVPTDIGRSGEIVGWSETSPNSYDHYEHAFRWTPQDGMVDLHRRDVNLGFRSWRAPSTPQG